MCGACGVGEAAYVPAGAEPGGALVLGGGVEQQLHPETDAEQRHAGRRPLAQEVVEPERPQVAHRPGKRADARDDDAVRGAISAWSLVTRTRAPTCSSAFSTERRLPIP
jgi:hypothetical protein